MTNGLVALSGDVVDDDVDATVPVPDGDTTGEAVVGTAGREGFRLHAGNSKITTARVRVMRVSTKRPDSEDGERLGVVAGGRVAVAPIDEVGRLVDAFPLLVFAQLVGELLAAG